MLDVDVGLYSARKTMLYVTSKIPLCPLRPWELWLVVLLVQSTGSNPGLASTMVRSRSGSFPKPAAGAARLR